MNFLFETHEKLIWAIVFQTMMFIQNAISNNNSIKTRLLRMQLANRKKKPTKQNNVNLTNKTKAV